MSALESSIVIITYTVIITIVLWLLFSYCQLQRALHWWYSRQHMRMCQEGEAIRDKMLQELFLARRYLELSETNCAENKNKSDKYYLNNLEKIHHSLKELSEYLYPAYIDDSLPLAIRCLFESWKLSFPKLNIQLKLPDDWYNEPHERSRAILIAIEELLQLTLSEISTSSIFVSLEKQEHVCELKIQLTCTDIFNLISYSRKQELDSLSRAFKFLTSGECFHYQQHSTQIWYFRWRHPKQSSIAKINSDVIDHEAITKRQL